MVVIPFPLARKYSYQVCLPSNQLTNHNKNGNIQDQGYKHGPIEIHDDVWLGAHVVVSAKLCSLKDVW